MAKIDIVIGPKPPSSAPLIWTIIGGIVGTLIGSVATPSTPASMVFCVLLFASIGSFVGFLFAWADTIDDP